jgi:hypothetical protein
VVVDVEGTGAEAKFTFGSTPKSALPEVTVPADIVPADEVAEISDAIPEN